MRLRPRLLDLIFVGLGCLSFVLSSTQLGSAELVVTSRRGLFRSTQRLSIYVSEYRCL